MSYFMDSGPKFTWLISPNAGGIVLNQVFPILYILTHSGDTRDQSLKLCKIDPNFTNGKKFLGEGPQMFGLAL